MPWVTKVMLKLLRSIEKLFLLQINITNDLAEGIINLVNNGIIERGLFHEAALSTFSTLIYFWKK